MIYEVRFAIFLCTLDLFLPISLSFLWLFYLWNLWDLRNLSKGWDQKLLLWRIASKLCNRHLSSIKSSKSRCHEKLLHWVKIRALYLAAEALEVFRNKAIGQVSVWKVKIIGHLSYYYIAWFLSMLI